MNFYPHHIGDYRSATVHLSNEEDLAYRRLIEMYYDTESYIPLDTQWVSRRLRLGCDVVQVVLNDFFFMTEDGYRHARCDLEIREYNIKADIARQNGRKGGRRKVATDKEKNPAGSNPVSTGLAKRTQALANHEPLPMNHEPLTNTKYKAAVPAFSPPDWINASHWATWHSCPKRKKATDEQKQMAVDKLDGWRKTGKDYATALENAALGGYQGLFLPDQSSTRKGVPKVYHELETMDYNQGVSDDGSF